MVQGGGSTIRFEVFENEDDEVPIDLWVAHRDKYVHKGDLKKVCDRFDITANDFAKLVG